MAKTKKKLTKEEKLAKDRERKKLKYEAIKSNPELYRVHQEKEKQRYLLKKEKKKVVSINEMSNREKREQRRKWRKNSLNYQNKLKEQKKIQQLLIENSPPESECEEMQEPRIIDEDDPLAVANPPQPPPEKKNETTKQDRVNKNENTAILKKTIRRMRYKHVKNLSEMKKKIQDLEKENEKLRINQNQEQTQKSNEDTIEKKVNKIIKDIKEDKLQEVKRKLLFSETIAKGFCEKYKTSAKKDKRGLAAFLTDNEKLSRYRILSKMPFSLKKKQAERNQGIKEARIKENVQNFFELDVNSQIAAGKKESIKRNGIRKQKRYLTDNLKNLHEKYCKQKGYIGYSTFCKYRPFWTMHPSNKRDTCQCKLHANANLLAESLKKSQIINEKSATDILSSLCCSIEQSTCLERTCHRCSKNVLNYKEFDNSRNVTYYEWILEKQSYTVKDGETRFKNVTTKKRKEENPRNLIKKLDSVLEALFKHCLTILVQYAEITKLKENLKNGEILCHVDFSENYCLKYHEEVQSFHFGGSRGQVALHTGVLYYLDQQNSVTTKTFCTMSQCLNHDASAIWAHITPILDLAQNLVNPTLKSIHFVSDSPSSQYRNRFIFHMLTKLKDQISSLVEVTWSYLEAGHGKGAPDGVGAVIKRAADNYVKYGGDVGSFEDFIRIVQENVQKVECIIIPQEEVLKKRFLTNIPGFKGTTKAHQVVWSIDMPFCVAFRTLSCFICRGSFLPCEHNKHLGVLTTGISETETEAPIANQIPLMNISCFLDPGQYDDPHLPSDTLEKQQNEVLDRDIDANGGTQSPLRIDTPTLYNNLKSLVTKTTLDGTTHKEDIINSTHGSSKKVNIISNVPYFYQRFSVRNDSAGFNSIDQNEYKKFLNSAESNDSSSDQQPSSPPDLNSVDTNDPLSDQQPSTPPDLNSADINEQPSTLPENDYNLKYDVDTWVVVEYKLKTCSQFYIGKIAETFANTKEYVVIFIRKVRGGLFSWPVVSDEDTVPESRIVQCMEDPQVNRRGQLSFKKMPKLNFK